MPSPPPAGHLVLAGGGHTHALVLLRWAMALRRGRPIAGGALVTLVSRASTALYSGMVPGLLAGIYDRDACAIDLRRLCRQAGVTFIAAEMTGLDPGARTLALQGRPPLHWDWLSLDVGSETAMPGGPVSAPSGSSPAQGVKPLEPFLAWAEARLAEAGGRGGRGTDLAIRGGGAAAVEIALALKGRGLRPELLLRDRALHLGAAASNRLGESLLAAASIPVRPQV
ncbi:MAG: bifunctional NADH dehydrogenase FAD-containing subunit/selenide, water dikinase SelD, partial [Prochlorococcaceae cyanobacterium]